ncbi:MAG: ferrochelatase [Candidatus Binatia bacterium]
MRSASSSPHASEAGRERYMETVAAGCAALGARAPRITYAPQWHVHPGFIEAIAAGVRSALERIPVARRTAARLVFTAHSIPRATAEASPYVAQLTASAAAVATALAWPRWQIAYQSRSGSPRDPWLEPDVNDVLRALAADGVRDVVVSPIGFVCDHVEVLYDLDVEAAATARDLGLGFARASAVNDHPAFIRMLAEVVLEAAG